ncbi:MAG: hypothetical protein ACM3VW_09620 [Bacteroidota bacterium]
MFAVLLPYLAPALGMVQDVLHYGHVADYDHTVRRVFTYCATATIRVMQADHCTWYDKAGYWLSPYILSAILTACTRRWRHRVSLVVAVNAVLAAIAAALTLLMAYS